MTTILPIASVAFGLIALWCLEARLGPPPGPVTWDDAATARLLDDLMTPDDVIRSIARPPAPLRYGSVSHIVYADGDDQAIDLLLHECGYPRKDGTR